MTDLDRARSFYRDVLGATVYREYEGTSSVLQFQGSWLLLVTAGGPTDDKPDVTFEPPQDPQRVSHSMTIRVPDCQEAYEVLNLCGLLPLLEYMDPIGGRRYLPWAAKEAPRAAPIPAPRAMPT